MTNQNDNWQPLEAALVHDEQVTGELLELLGRERTLLEQRQYAGFEELLRTKRDLLAALEQNTLHRRQWQQAMGFSDDNAALDAAGLEAPQLAERWRTLADQWQHCQHGARVNDQICQRTRTVVGRVLDILSGNSGQGATYDAGGTQRRLQRGRNITTA